MTSEDDSQDNANSANTSGFTTPALDDTLIFCSLIAFAVLFLYSFIKYLKRNPTSPEDSSNTNTSTNELLNDRRFRFGRLRRNSGNKPWLEPLEPQDPFDLNDDDPELRHDADRLIQSDISTETVLMELDPMGSLSTLNSSNHQMTTASSKKYICQCQKYEWLGIGLAAVVSIIFIAIFSNIESE